MLLKNYGFQSEAATDLKNIIKTFSVERAYEGPQILLNWDFFNDADVAEFKILKKEGAYPLSVNDGILTVSGNDSGSFGDLNVSPSTIYYYTLFIKLAGETKFVFDTIGMGKAMAIKTGCYQDVLWRLMPSVYKVQDIGNETLQKGLVDE